MDKIRDRFNGGRRAMIDAFADISTLARRAGVDEGAMTELCGRFFDGNVEIKHAFGACILLAEIWRPRNE